MRPQIKEYFYSIATDERKGLIAFCIKVILLIISWIYFLSIQCVSLFYRIGLFQKYALKIKVLSVGNITMGGTGKTPMVEMIAEFLKVRGGNPAVLLRGYMEDSLSQSDEASLLEGSLKGIPVLVGADRVHTGQQAIDRHRSNILILDDGFQHWRLKRDLDIVAVDATRPFGNGCLLPRGILREPLSSLKRADIIVLTKMDLASEEKEELKKRVSFLSPSALVVEASHKPSHFIALNEEGNVKDVSVINGKSVCAFCSIGNSESFRGTLTCLGADVKKHYTFMDHYTYKSDDIDGIIQFCSENNIDTVVTTQKDAVKIRDDSIRFGSIALLSLVVRMEIIHGQEGFFKKILKIVKDS